ncbi:hypothetical protein [Naasia aerilata]|uniref:DUF3093 family protein n=1 Tax=Naasia aerilata TaxID=1162966 RepID=A0ABN6XT20_9MICO|nr:hypothetical protein [Naasia aerilata]BDZ46801.1 hypothetical protein GCM10025866_27100 [Naasia aerilata]
MLLVGPLLAIVLVAVFVVPTLDRTGGGGAIAWPILAVVLVIMVLAIAAGLLLGKRLVGDRIEVAVRSSGDKWHHARLTDIGDGRLRLERYFWQVRIPTGKKLELHVLSLGEDSGRHPRPRQWWSLNPQLTIVDLETDQGTFELAALPSHLRELRERLQEPASA